MYVYVIHYVVYLLYIFAYSRSYIKVKVRYVRTYNEHGLPATHLLPIIWTDLGHETTSREMMWASKEAEPPVVRFLQILWFVTD